jgi:hypothetical protein
LLVQCLRYCQPSLIFSRICRIVAGSFNFWSPSFWIKGRLCSVTGTLGLDTSKPSSVLAGAITLVLRDKLERNCSAN